MHFQLTNKATDGFGFSIRSKEPGLDQKREEVHGERTTMYCNTARTTAL